MDINLVAKSDLWIDLSDIDPEYLGLYKREFTYQQIVDALQHARKLGKLAVHEDDEDF